MDLQIVHNNMDFLANKEQNFWTPEEKDNALHVAQMWLFAEGYRLYARNQEVQDAMAPFKVTYTFTPDNTPNGLITFDDDYAHFLGAYLQFYNNNIQAIDYQSFKEVNEGDLGARLRSQLTPVTAITPIVLSVGKGKYQLYPKVPSTGYAFYLKNPTPPKFVYTMVGRVKTYNQSNSTQLEWNDNSVNEIIIKALQFLGVNVGDGQLVQFSTAKDEQKI